MRLLAINDGMGDLASRRRASAADHADEGYMLVACIVLVFLMLLALSVAAPSVARGLEREREVESQHRAEQYVRAIRVYYRKNGHYPGSLDQLKNTNNQKYLRQEYVDPLTGKSDWRLIHVGENKTKVKGLFGADLPGIASNIGGSSLGGASTAATSTFGSSSQASTTTGTNSATGTTGIAGTTGLGSTDATQASGGGGGPIMGVGTSKSGDAMLVVNEKTRFEDWEFLYDPRIEQLYAKGLLNSGIGSSSATSGSGTGASAFPSIGGTQTQTPTSTQTPTPQQ